MPRPSILSYLWRLLVTALVFFVGLMIGSMVATAVGLPMPAMPAGAEANTLLFYTALTTPLLALAVVMVAQGLPGRFWERALVLSWFTWLVYAVNTVIEASIFTNYNAASWFTVLMFGVASLFVGGGVALLFPPGEHGNNFIAVWRYSFQQRPAAAWLWRLLLAALSFMPIYLFFGRLVYPVVGDYYQQQTAGLVAPGWGQILPVLFVRSLLFLLACLPVVITWQQTKLALFLRLGLALFILVGLVYMIQAYYLPSVIRLAHSVEILADSFVHAGALVLLLGRGEKLYAYRRSFTASQTFWRSASGR